MDVMIDTAASRANERQCVRVRTVLRRKTGLPVSLGAGATAAAGMPIGTSHAMQMSRAMQPYDSPSLAPDFEKVMKPCQDAGPNTMIVSKSHFHASQRQSQKRQRRKLYTTGRHVYPL